MVRCQKGDVPMSVDTLPQLKAFFDVRERIFRIKHEQLSMFDEVFPRDSMPLKAYNREFATIHMNFGRRTGASYWMCTKTKALAAEGYHILICAINFHSISRMKSMYLEAYPDWTGELGKHIDFTTINVLDRAEADSKLDLKIRGVDYVFVDVSPLMKEKTMDVIYENFTGHLIVLL